MSFSAGEITDQLKEQDYLMPQFRASSAVYDIDQHPKQNRKHDYGYTRIPDLIFFRQLIFKWRFAAFD